MADLQVKADIDQLLERRMHDDQIDAERPVGERPRRLDLGGEQTPASSSRRR